MKPGTGDTPGVFSFAARVEQIGITVLNCDEELGQGALFLEGMKDGS